MTPEADTNAQLARWPRRLRRARRLASWSAMALAIGVILLTISNYRWEATWRIAPGCLLGTRNGALKIIKDWHGDPSRDTITGWYLERRAQGFDWAGRWLYDSTVGWYEVPLWLVIALAFIPSIVLRHAGLPLLRRLKARRIAAGLLFALAGLCILAIPLSLLWRGSISQGRATLSLERACFSLQLDHTSGMFFANGPVTADWQRKTQSPTLLPSWADNGVLFTLDVPLWLLPLLLVASALLLRRLGSIDPRLLAGHCPGCGYDQRGLPSANPCPECGRVPSIERNLKPAKL